MDDEIPRSPWGARFALLFPPPVIDYHRGSVVGIVGGSSLLRSGLFQSWQERTVETPYGEVRLKERDGAFFLQRHGRSGLPPHRINHRANLFALHSVSVQRIVSINSVGSLRPELRPGTFLIPHDFISFYDVPTFFEEEMKFTVPVLERSWALEVLDIGRRLGMDVRYGGVYVQTKGPRLETRAEVAMFRNFGDVIGMTMASEATLAIELGVPYASLCSIDNYCHGVVEHPLSVSDIEEQAERSLRMIESFLEAFLEHYSHEDPA
jgi:5'-methylthioadenosine phosphorylase